MKRDEIKNFLNEFDTPFRIITKKGTIITCMGLVELRKYSIVFKDRFNMTVIQELSEISTLQTLNRKGVK